MFFKDVVPSKTVRKVIKWEDEKRVSYVKLSNEVKGSSRREFIYLDLCVQVTRSLLDPSTFKENGTVLVKPVFKSWNQTFLRFWEL